MNSTIYLAPIQGITECLFRNVFPKYFKGFDLAIAPFISTSHSNKLRGVVARELDPRNNLVLKTIPQILGNNPEDFITLSNSLYDVGYAVINWNLGCPFPLVVNKGKGSGMLPRPDLIESFLEKVIPQLKSKISIKLRLGLHSTEEILQLIPIFNRYPLHELIIHPRTGKQMYRSFVDLDAFEKCIPLSQHSLVYNGDINSLSTFQMLSKRFNTIDKWMIGRGSLINPFLAQEIKQQDLYSDVQKLDLIINFHNELFEEYAKITESSVHMVDKMKEIWTMLGHCFENTKTIQYRIFRVQGLQNYKELIKHLFDNELLLKT